MCVCVFVCVRVCVCLFFITRGNGTMCTDTRVEHSSKASVSLSKQQQQIQGLSEVSEAIRTNVEALLKRKRGKIIHQYRFLFALEKFNATIADGLNAHGREINATIAGGLNAHGREINVPLLHR